MARTLLLAGIVAAGLWYGLIYHKNGSVSLQVQSQEKKEFAQPQEKLQGPQLVVLVVFDQMRADYLVKWKEHFGEGGFKRLEKESAWFTNCHYPYSDTLTAAGHASLSTGTTPNEHGIIANDWYDRNEGKNVKAVSDIRGLSAKRRRRETFSDLLLAKTHDKSKIAGLSIKDRAAMMLAALRAQIVYWLGKTGDFQTTYTSRPDIHDWVKAYNQSGKVKSFIGRPWELFNPKLEYLKFSGIDDSPFEGSGFKQGRTFPHPTLAVDAVENSAWGNEILLDFVKTAIENEKLGQRGVPDFLGISFSSNDLVGHCFGPDSQEVLDITLRSDKTVQELLEYLDAKVGKGNYVFALSADHGVCPLPEISKSQGKEAERISSAILTSKTEEFLQEKFAKGKPKQPWVEADAGPWVYLNQKTIEQQGLKSAEVEKALAEYFTTQPGVARAFTRTQISGAKPLEDPLAERVRLSFHPECSGDVMVMLKPYHLLWNVKKAGTAYATTHGSPYPYDTHVPLIVMGPGINPGIYTDLVAPQILPRLFCHALDIEPAKSMNFPFPKTVAAEKK